jgi:hypothetical protein
MSGCSIDEAFPDTALQAGRIARKEERKKAKKCGGPALAFLKAGGEGNSLDPDRQHLNPLPEVNALKGSEGFSSEQSASNCQWIPKKTTDAQEKEDEFEANLVGQKVDDVIGQKSRMTLPRAVSAPNQLPDPAKDMFGSSVASYFGKSSEESYADFSSSMKDNPGYQLTGQHADFLGSFAAVNLDKASGKPALSTPSINDAWRPLTPSGAKSSFFDLMPEPSGRSLENGGGIFSREEKESLLKKLDTLFARLDDLESKKNEYAHVEVSMFVLSGLFLIYGIDALRRVRV